MQLGHFLIESAMLYQKIEDTNVNRSNLLKLDELFELHFEFLKSINEYVNRGNQPFSKTF